MIDKPIEKYPVNYKCTHIYHIIYTMKKCGLHPTNIKSHNKEDVDYRIFHLFDFLNIKIQQNNTIYPNKKNNIANNFIERGSVILIPRYYDSDNEQLKKVNINKHILINAYHQIYKGEELKNKLNNVDDYVKNGINNYEWINIQLEFIYQNYKEYYIDGQIKVWMPFQWETYNDYKLQEKDKYTYPENKMLYLSDIEKYLNDKYGIKDDDFYFYIIKNNDIEYRNEIKVLTLDVKDNRHWERTFGLYINEDKKFYRENDIWGINPSENISNILNIIETDFKELMDKYSKYKYFPIYIDYYKKIKPNKLY